MAQKLKSDFIYDESEAVARQFIFHANAKSVCVWRRFIYWPFYTRGAFYHPPVRASERRPAGSAISRSGFISHLFPVNFSRGKQTVGKRTGDVQEKTRRILLLCGFVKGHFCVFPLYKIYSD